MRVIAERLSPIAKAEILDQGSRRCYGEERPGTSTGLKRCGKHDFGPL